MKKILLLLTVQIAGFAYAQPVSYLDFKTEDQEIIYQKVFSQDSITAVALGAYYKNLPYVSNLTTSPDGVQFDVNDITVDYKKFQFKQTDTPSIIQTGKYSGQANIGVKDGKYRITFRSIQL